MLIRRVPRPPTAAPAAGGRGSLDLLRVYSVGVRLVSSRRRRGGSGAAGVVLWRMVLLLVVDALWGAGVDPFPPAGLQICGDVRPVFPIAGCRGAADLAGDGVGEGGLHQFEVDEDGARWRSFGAEFCRLPVRQGSPSVPGRQWRSGGGAPQYVFVGDVNFVASQDRIVIFFSLWFVL